MPQIEVDDRTYRELELLAVAWHTTITEAVDRLVAKLATRATVRAQHMDDHEACAETQADLIDVRTRRLAKAAAAVDEPTDRALAEVARGCGPDTIDALVTLLTRVRINAPDRIAACPVVAFVRYGTAEGVPPVRGAAITADGTGRYNVHTVFWHEDTARWDGSNGRYGVTWDVARDALNRRADADVAP